MNSYFQTAYGQNPIQSPLVTRLNQYEQMFPPVQPQVPPILTVNGIDEARNWNIPNNSSIVLMDSIVNKYYLKTSDQYGRITVRSFTYYEDTAEDNPFEKINQKLEKLEEEMRCKNGKSVQSDDEHKKCNSESAKVR